MEIIIRLLDIASTFSEVLLLYVCAEMVCKEMEEAGRRRYLPYAGLCVVIYLTTWIIPMDTTKIIIEMIFWCLLMRAVTGEKWRNLITSFFLAFYLIVAVSFLEMTLCQLLFGANTIVIGDKAYLIWQDYVLAIIVKLFAAVWLFRYRKRFQYEIRIRDVVLLSFVTAVFFASCFSFGKEFFAGKREWYDVAGGTIATLFCLCFLLLMMFYKNNGYLREQNLLAAQQVREAQMQYQYYLEKEKQEERVRSIYHDMKNHLLVLENLQVSEETRRMAEKIRNEIAGYEDYIRSGNKILDIILKDKARRAKEMQIDFSAFADFSSASFIEPLDISTIFGNGIDNALEACGKLPPQERVITVKGCKKENFILILIENNYAQTQDFAGRGTEKDDAFLHGFGISNIERAARKYGGECRIRKKDGRFSLTVIIPCPPGWCN